MNQFVSAQVEHFNCCVFLRGEEQPATLSVYRKVVEIAIVKSRHRDRLDQLQWLDDLGPGLERE